MIYVFLFQGGLHRGTLGWFFEHGEAIDFLRNNLRQRITDVVADYPRAGCQTYCLNSGMYALFYQSLDRDCLPVALSWMEELISGFDLSRDRDLIKFKKRFPDLSAQAINRANCWEYIPICMLTLNWWEKAKLRFDILTWGASDTMEEILGRWLLMQEPRYKWKQFVRSICNRY